MSIIRKSSVFLASLVAASDPVYDFDEEYVGDCLGHDGVFGELETNYLQSDM